MCLPSKISGVYIQKISILLGNMLCFNFGAMFGITPPLSILYRSSGDGITPLNRPVQEISTIWMSSFLFLGAAIGALFSILSRKIGPKSVLLMSGLLQVTAWFCIHFAYDILHIYSSRFFAGLAGGATFVVLPLFAIEITEDTTVRSRLITSCDQWCSIGICCGLWMGAYLKYDYIAIIGVFVSVAFTLTFAFVQESPYYYLRKNNEIFMEKSLRWFRGIRQLEDRENPAFLREVEEFKRQMQDIQQPSMIYNMPLAYKIKLVLYCSALTVGVQFSGIFVMLNYALEITSFQLAALIWGVALLFGSVLSTYTTLRLKRKVTLLVSSLACALLWFVLIGVTAWQAISSNTKLALVIGLVSVIMFLVNIGMQPIATSVMCEMLPSELRSRILGAANSVSWLMLFLVIQSYAYLSFVGITIYFILFGCCCLLLSLFVLFVLPETYGCSLEDIQRSMNFIPNENVAKVTTIPNDQNFKQIYF